MGDDDYSIHGHAIVSADDCIAAADGSFPPALRNAADRARFQAALDAAAVTVLGRRAHETHANPKARNRLVVSSTAHGVERRADAWWWNPAEADMTTALVAAAPDGGIVAVPGGRRVFDLFLTVGFDEFHLARAEQAVVPDGIPVFSAVADGVTPEAVLAAHGLVAGPREVLDPAAVVSVTVWRRATLTG